MSFYHCFFTKTPTLHCIDERGIVEEPYQTPDNMSRKKGFVIVVQQLYKWKYSPVAKVLFCDCQRFADMLRNKSERTQMELMESFWSVTWRCDVADGIVADQQVSAMSFPVFLSEKKRAWVMSCLQMSFHGRQRFSTLDKYIVSLVRWRLTV